jgi:two-component system OmpR family response regulator
MGFGRRMNSVDDGFRILVVDDGFRILVVDDEPNIVDVISMALRYQGFDVATAGNGSEALNQVKGFRPHLMLLDVMLPDIEASRWPSGWGLSVPECRSSS